MSTCKDCLHNNICEKLRPIEYCLDKPCSCFKSKADVVEVRHGKWVYNEQGCISCSVCGKHFAYMSEIWEQKANKFCRNCGAKMDGKEEK